MTWGRWAAPAEVSSKGLKRTSSISSLVLLQALPGGGESFVKQNAKIVRNPSRPTPDGERCPAQSAAFRAYWSLLREIVIEDSVLVLVQRMSSRR